MKLEFIKIEASAEELRAGTTIADAIRTAIDRISYSFRSDENYSSLDDTATHEPDEWEETSED